MRGNLEVYRAFFILLTYMFKPRYDTKLQLLIYQVTMLRDRIDDSRIMPTDRERAELLRLGAEIEHDISDVMMVVKPATYKGWLRRRDPDRKKLGAGRPGTPQATVNLVMNGHGKPWMGLLEDSWRIEKTWDSNRSNDHPGYSETGGALSGSRQSEKEFGR